MKLIINNFINSNIDIKILRISIILIFILFGTYKWFTFEINALQPIFTKSWLRILPNIFGNYGASYFLGLIETMTFITLITGYLKPKIGVIGDLLVIITGITTLSLLPQLGVNSFIVKDILLVGGGLVLLKFDLTSIYR